MAARRKWFVLLRVIDHPRGARKFLTKREVRECIPVGKLIAGVNVRLAKIEEVPKDDRN
jgi:hypothetical protein